MIDLPTDIINPNVLSPERRYAGSGYAVTPWFNAAQADRLKLAHEIRARASGLSAENTIAIDYALDYSDQWTRLALLTQNGRHVFPLPSSANPVGMLFDSIRFRVTAARGGDATESPDLNMLALEFETVLDTLWGWELRLDLNDKFNGLEPEQMVAALEAAQVAQVKVPFTYRRSTDEAPTTHYVHVQQLAVNEDTGDSHKANVRVSLVGA